MNKVIDTFGEFVSWANGKTFNEILGCAKIGINNVLLLHDVDEYDNNKMAITITFRSKNNVSIEVEIEYDYVFKCLKFTEVKTTTIFIDNKPQTIGEYENKFIKLLGEYDDDLMISLWNRIPKSNRNFGYEKFYILNKENLNNVISRYSSEDITEILFNMGVSLFNPDEKYFYITDDLRFESFSNIWGHIDCELVYDFIVRNNVIFKYGRIWDTSDYTSGDIENEDDDSTKDYPLMKIQGVQIYVNYYHGYLMFEENNVKFFTGY